MSAPVPGSESNKNGSLPVPGSESNKRAQMLIMSGDDAPDIPALFEVITVRKILSKELGRITFIDVANSGRQKITVNCCLYPQISPGLS